jgi:transcriptional regulator with XRE-family HTH domain
VSDFPENLRRVIFEKRLKAVDVARATKITPPTISRYLSGTHHPTTDNLITISKFLGVSPEALLSSSEASESSGSSKYISSDKDKVIAVQEELIKNLQKQVGDLERQSKLSHSPLYTDELRSLKAQVDMLRAQNDQWKASSEARHPKGSEKAKHPNTPHKEMVEYLKKNKPKK